MMNSSTTRRILGDVYYRMAQAQGFDSADGDLKRSGRAAAMQLFCQRGQSVPVVPVKPKHPIGFCPQANATPESVKNFGNDVSMELLRRLAKRDSIFGPRYPIGFRPPALEG
jgi:hypothetical protein